MKEHNYYIYILANKRNGTLYVGVTNNLLNRAFQHKAKFNEGFTEKYKVDKLVYYEHYNNINDAINREKVLKKWNRKWKIELIEKSNPEWMDVYLKI